MELDPPAARVEARSQRHAGGLAGAALLARARSAHPQALAVALAATVHAPTTNLAAELGVPLLARPFGWPTLRVLVRRAEHAVAAGGRVASARDAVVEAEAARLALTPGQRAFLRTHLDGDKDLTRERLRISGKTYEKHVTAILARSGEGLIMHLVARLLRAAHELDDRPDR